jgi:hypothetical protein
MTGGDPFAQRCAGAPGPVAPVAGIRSRRAARGGVEFGAVAKALKVDLGPDNA